jgi:hypothetical protein
VQYINREKWTMDQGPRHGTSWGLKLRVSNSKKRPRCFLPLLPLAPRESLIHPKPTRWFDYRKASLIKPSKFTYTALLSSRYSTTYQLDIHLARPCLIRSSFLLFSITRCLGFGILMLRKFFSWSQMGE